MCEAKPYLGNRMLEHASVLVSFDWWRGGWLRGPRNDMVADGT